MCGSGWVAVVPLDRAEQGGHFDTKMGIWLWLWWLWWRLGLRSDFFVFLCTMNGWGTTAAGSGGMCGSGWVAVVPLDRAEQGGHFDTKMGIWLWLWWLWWLSQDEVRFFCFLRTTNGWGTTAAGSGGACAVDVGSGWVAVVSLDRAEQGGSNGTG
jgi:hypothetical protein